MKVWTKHALCFIFSCKIWIHLLFPVLNRSTVRKKWRTKVKKVWIWRKNPAASREVDLWPHQESHCMIKISFVCWQKWISSMVRSVSDLPWNYSFMFWSVIIHLRSCPSCAFTHLCFKMLKMTFKILSKYESTSLCFKMLLYI